MNKQETIKLKITGLNCANCAAKIERKLNELEYVDSAILDYINQKILINFKNNSEIIEEKNLITSIQQLVDSYEDGVTVSSLSPTQPLNNSNKIQCQCHNHNHENGHSHSHSHTHESHGHSHNHNYENSELKNLIKKIILGGFLFLIGFIIPKDKIFFKFLIFFASYIIIGGDVLFTAFKNIKRGQIFDENFLMSIATIGAFIIGEFPEGVAVMLFYQLGELFQSMAVNKSRNSIVDLMNIRPDYANLKINDKIEKVSPENVKIGDLIIVKPGEKVPLDGEILDGNSIFDTSALTGESLPKEIFIGENVLSGYINKSSLITVKVTKLFSESTVSKILDLVENATTKKSKTESFITKFARYYTPAVVIIALLIAILPPLFIKDTTFYTWLYRALVFLVVSCPCALVISIPLGFFGGIGGASKHGILIKGANYLEALNNVDTVVMDKTGTLTKGIFKVTEINNTNISKEELLKYAAYAESFSTHPIAQSIVTEYENQGNIINKNILSNFEEKSGYGIKVNIQENNITNTIIVGNLKLMELEKINIPQLTSIGTTVYVGINGNYVGNILIADEIKEDSISAISQMKKIGVKNTIMLTGDNKIIGENIGKQLNIDKVYTELLPDQKVEKLEEIFDLKINNKNDNGKIIFVGDGINDAPVLARADIGIAMGGLGSDAAIEAADVVIMNDEPSKIVTAIKIAKKTKEIVWQNIAFTLIIKIIVLILGAGGLATMWEAVFADVGVALLAVLNATRIIKAKFD